MASAPARGRWRSAATIGLADPVLAAAADEAFALAAVALRARHPALADLVVAFTERYVSERRCPADDHHLTAATTEAR